VSKIIQTASGIVKMWTVERSGIGFLGHPVYGQWSSH